MRLQGAFAASEDADSEGEEGRFYVWTEAEIDTALSVHPAADVARFQGGLRRSPRR